MDQTEKFLAQVATLPLTEQSIRQTFNQFLKELFEQKLISGCLTPLELPNRATVVQTLVTNPEKLALANPFAPVMPVNSARILQQMTRLGPSPHPLALVMRPCEIRALVDLVKLKQVHLENCLVIGFDCFGAYPIETYTQFAAQHPDAGEAFLQAAQKNQIEPELRWNCQVCQYPSPLFSDLTLALVGNEAAPAISMIANTQAGETVLKHLGLQLKPITKDRATALDAWITRRTQKRPELIESARQAAAGPKKMLDFLSTCIHCLNCMTNCPVCYCKECFFNSATFELDAAKYFDWAEQRGGIRMPSDTVFFHLTRMTHMATSCVACGACSEACPSHIEIARLFTVVGERTQKLFNYVAGRALDEPLPLVEFKEQELETFDR
ncbi:Coenzyme F420 hydrogenase/dehydrogenase, beta subunit C-terminal domain [candidate division KSB1 bacterium]|nr:Coenzyme F420 hydrogenase/dehydrogenase, beta subunit C-terminal domain [candidate division KSB1 bacterium]